MISSKTVIVLDIHFECFSWLCYRLFVRENFEIWAIFGSLELFFVIFKTIARKKNYK